MNKTIAQWKDINQKLTKLVEGMNAACLATGLVLTIKNFVSNVGGKSLARQNVMTGDGGWNQKCMNAVSTKTLDGKPVPYKTVEDCITAQSSVIDAQVDTMYKTMQQQDAEMKILQEKCPSTQKGFFTETVIDSACLQEKYSEKLSTELRTSLAGYTFKVNNQVIPSEEVIKLIETKKLSVEDMRAIQLYSRMGDFADSSSLSGKNINKLFADAYVSGQAELAAQKVRRILM